MDQYAICMKIHIEGEKEVERERESKRARARIVLACDSHIGQLTQDNQKSKIRSYFFSSCVSSLYIFWNGIAAYTYIHLSVPCICR